MCSCKDVEVAARDSVVSPTAAPQSSIASPLSPTSAHISAHEQSSAPPPVSKKPVIAQKPAIAHKPAVMPKPSTESVSNAAQHSDISRSVQPTKLKPTMIRSSSLRVVSGEVSNTAQPAPHTRQHFDAHTTDTRMSAAPKPAVKPRLSIAGDMQATVSQLAEPNNVHWKPAKPSPAVIPAASHTPVVISAKPTPTLISAVSHTPVVIPTGDDGGKCDVSSKKPPPPRPPNPASGKRMSVSEDSQQQVNARPWSYTSQQPAKLSVDKPSKCFLYTTQL